MRILVIDEDERDVPQICDELRQLENEVQLVSRQSDILPAIKAFKPEGLVLDLMMPPEDLPTENCGGGYTTGGYLYQTLIHDNLPGIPFVIFSSAFIDADPVKHTILALSKYTECQGVLSKGCDAEDIVSTLFGG